SPVQNAPYTLTLDDGSVIEGTLDASGKATIENMPAGQYTIQYGEDSREFEPVENTTANPLFGKISPEQAVKMVESGDTDLLNQAGDIAEGAGDWLWGTLQGDFNKDPSTTQIVVGTIISMIPVIDQVMDCRDVCANMAILTDEDDKNDSDGWLALTLTAIGLVPILGSALKGTFKVIIKNAGASLDAAFAILRKLGKGDPEKFLKNLDWAKLTSDATNASKQLLNTMKDSLQTILNSWFMRKLLDNNALKSIEDGLGKMSAFEKRLGDGINQGMGRIRGYVDEALAGQSKGRLATGNTSSPLKAKTAELDASTIPLPYEIKKGLSAFDSSPIIFKRIHKDGQQEGMWPDSYTLMPDGKPMGSIEGIMPAKFKGIKKLPADAQKRIDEGWPDIASRADFANFTNLEAATLPKGTKIYRIIDEGTSEATKKNSGSYWAFDLPSTKTQWRKDYAVKDSWNDNGHYIEHTLEEDLKVWTGGVAGQRYEEFNTDNFYLEGGNTQIFAEYGLLKDAQIQPQLTNWPDAI
ncbi:hypothetical protein SAMN02745724_02507, partial [Pseudoalteromonas denitrificans DSM 6059]